MAATKIEIFSSVLLPDVEVLRPVLEDSIRYPDTGNVIQEEVEEDLRSVTESQTEGSDLYVAIARLHGGAIVGMMGLKSPDKTMQAFTTSQQAGELRTAYVSRNARGLGAGRALVAHLEDQARKRGMKELILNSGPRYQHSGWPFWRAVYGDPVGTLPDYYGAGAHTMVWRKSLS